MFVAGLILFSILASTQSFEICGQNYTIPYEGFKRKSCIPGHYDGSCLLLFSKPVTFKEALTNCHVEYGGRLATADSDTVFKKWIKRIYRDLKFQVKENTRFWIGYGRDSFYDMTPRKRYGRAFFEMNYWNRAFRGRNLKITLPWENNADLNLLNGDPCSSHATVFNPNNAKFNVRSVEEKYPYLCETPRYPKFKCSEGWHLVPETRMCILLRDYRYNSTFFEAVDACRREEAFIFIPNTFIDINRANAISALHGISSSKEYLWSGAKRAREDAEIQTLDGTKTIFDPDNANTECLVIWGKKIRNATTKYTYFGHSESCSLKFPYICQKFVDQAFTLDAE